MMFSDAGSSLEASSKTPMACDGGIGFNIPGSISIPPRPSSAMSREGIGFPPLRIDRGEGESILAGTQGEILRVDEFGGAIGVSCKPFPATCVDGAYLEDSASRESLRLTANSREGLHPAGSIWSRTLDYEPMKMGSSGESLVFTTKSGMYMVDKEAREIWREELPHWPEISREGISDRVVGVEGVPGGVVIFSQAGGVSVIDPSNGSTIYSRILNIRDRVSKVCYSEENGWMILLHSNSVIILEKIEGEPSLIETPGPVLDAESLGDEWRWTGWRHDGRISGDRMLEIVNMDGIGVGILGGLVLTNDGHWRKFGWDNDSSL